jgi:regulator of PEP synthase PpsR (kinase-PPPase family)
MPMSCMIGISRTSKTPTSIYLANRGIKTANIPVVYGVPLPDRSDSRRRSRWWFV